MVSEMLETTILSDHQSFKTYKFTVLVHNTFRNIVGTSIPMSYCLMYPCTHLLLYSITCVNKLKWNSKS